MEGDLDNDINDENGNIAFYKFADDGTGKAVADTKENCIKLFHKILNRVNYWTCKWRMVVNCQKNKTEVICLYSEDKMPDSFDLGNKKISLTEKSKVLGIVLYKYLNYSHQTTTVLNKLNYRWVKICQYTNRNWGLNQRVLTRLYQVIICSTLFYGSVIWMRERKIAEIQKLWYRMTKTALGAVFNVDQATA